VYPVTEPDGFTIDGNIIALDQPDVMTPQKFAALSMDEQQEWLNMIHHDIAAMKEDIAKLSSSKPIKPSSTYERMISNQSAFFLSRLDTHS